MNENEIRLTIKDEMKNKISMALKDPILQQGFEIICKENAELKEALKDKRCNCMTYLNFKDLEKECAKAKEIIKYLCGMVRELNKPNVQLTNINYSLSEAEQFLKESE